LAFESGLGVTEGEADAGLIQLKTAKCLGYCAHAPVLQADDLLCRLPEIGLVPVWLRDLNAGPFRKLQTLNTAIAIRPALGAEAVVLRHAIRNVPGIADARAAGIYDAWLAAAQLTPKRMVERFKIGTLRDSDGGLLYERLQRSGFQRTAKQRAVALDAAAVEPGNFADRILLERDPHSMLEGLLLAARAMRATRAIVRIPRHAAQTARVMERAIADMAAADDLRGATPCAVEILQTECEREAGPLARAAELRLSAETASRIGWLFQQEPAPQRAESGTQVVGLSAGFARPGLYEVPAGASIRAIVDKVGGGACADDAIWAVQIGGPAGVLLPKKAWDATLQSQGVRGAAGMVALGNKITILDVLQNSLEHAARCGCGLCVPCRIGTFRALVLIRQIGSGQNMKPALAELQALCATIRDAALCSTTARTAQSACTILQEFKTPAEACDTLVEGASSDGFFNTKARRLQDSKNR
jgi:NADH:ubiquinone oxidoreductase subunit F (NADH-binding)